MRTLLSAWFVARHRMPAHWRLLLATGLGVLLASTLLAMVPIYTNTMSDLGLRFRLEEGLGEPAERVVFLGVEGSRLGDPVDAQQRAAIDMVTDERIGWLGDELLVEDRSQRLQGSLSRASATAWPTFLVAMSELDSHVEVVDGRLPSPEGSAEVVLPDGYQRLAGIGDTVSVTLPTLNDCPQVPTSEDPAIAAAEVRCVPTVTATPTGIATIVGFVRRRDPSDLRWQFFESSWTAPDTPNSRATQPGPGALLLLTTDAQYEGAFAHRLPELRSRHRAGLVPDVQGMGLGDVPYAISDLRQWQEDLRTTLGLQASGRLSMVDRLERFREAQTFSRVPLLVMLLQVVGVIAFYVVLVASMLAERQATELSVYRSRGASSAQLVGLAALEGLVLAIPAAALAPWLASRAVALLGYTPAFTAGTGGDTLPASVSPEAYLLAAAGAALSILAMTLPAWAAARRGILDDRRERTRPHTRGVVQRYYLDAGVVVIAALQFWQLERRGTIFDPQSVGGWSSDPLLLLFPLVLTLAVAATVLRFYGVLLRLVMRVLIPTRGVAAAVGLRQTARSPATHTRVLLLLIMSASVATFAASYGPTVGRSFRERAEYDAGVDLRATLSRPSMEALEQVPRVRALAGVADAMVAFRGVLRARNGQDLTVLGVDDLARATPMLWTRDDFADQPLGEMLLRLQPADDPGRGIPLPDGAVALEPHFFLDQQASLYGLAARIRNGEGRYFEVPFIEVLPRAWGPMRSPIPADEPRPLTLVGFRQRDDTFVRREGTLFIDDIFAVDEAGRSTIVEDFEEATGTWAIYTQAGMAESFEVSTRRVRTGSWAASWRWETSFSKRESVLAVTDRRGPIPALFSERALASAGVREGDTAQLAVENGIFVPVLVAGTLRLFPTLDPEPGFVVFDRGALRAAEGTTGVPVSAFATELWVDFHDDASLHAQRVTVDQLRGANSPVAIEDVRHQAALVDRVNSDPTLVAGGSGILLIAAAAVLAIGAAGFAVTSLLAVGARVTEFAVLRALGVSGRQMLSALVLEWGVLALAGMVLGVMLGRQIAAVMLSSLNVTSEGTSVVPPFIMQTDWLTMAGGSVVIIAVAAAALVFAWSTATRQADSAALRLTQ